MFGKWGAVAVAVAMSVTGVAAASGTTTNAPLPAGNAAGIKNAESWQGDHHLLWLVGGGIVVGGIVLVATGNGHGSISNCTLPGCTAPTTTTTTTPPTTTTGTTTTSTTTGTH